ncbi:MAG: NADH-quinone oxidoreductase subunit M [Fidelibacterota bacterium]
MTWVIDHSLTVLILLPVAGALLCAAVPSRHGSVAKWIAVAITVLELGLCVIMTVRFESTSDFQFVQQVPWIPEWAINYSVGVDGISLLLILLTTFLGPVTVLCSWDCITRGVKGFMVSLLITEGALVGVFSSINLFLFYIFWEAVLIPMTLIIGVWGTDRRIYSAVKFILFTMLGSLLMLVGIIYLYTLTTSQFGSPTLDYETLQDLVISRKVQTLLFLAFALSFAIKVPLFPFHTWLPDAHSDAPTAGSIILAGILLKMGAYGLVRFCVPLFPLAIPPLVPVIIFLSVFGIIYGALMAMIQPDIKRLVAFSSVSHLGFVVLGIFSLTSKSISGGIIQMVNHGLSTGALFLLVGMLYDRRHTRMIQDFGGLAKVIPAYSALFIVVALASLGLPGLNGFVGEFLILLGSFPVHPVAVVLATLGVVLAAVYLLWLVERVFFGPVTREENAKLVDLVPREWAAVIPLVLAIVWLGVYPKPFLEKIEPSVDRLVRQVEMAVDRSGENDPVWTMTVPGGD